MTTPPVPPDGAPNRFAPPNAPVPPPNVPMPPPPPAPPMAPTQAGAPGYDPGPAYGSGAPYAPGTYYAPDASYPPGFPGAPGLDRPAPQPPLDPLAVASIPASLVPPVGLGLGIAGLVRTSAGRRRGRGLAWTGTALGAALTLGGVAVAAVLAMTATEWRELEPDVAAPTTVNAVQVAVGNCIQQLPADGEEISGIRVVPCTDEHRAQAVASTTLPDGAFPGAEKAVSLSSRSCGADVLGEDPPDGLELVVWAPTADSWAEGDRTGLCLVRSKDPLTDDYAG